jgi:uncharacterized membrane protein YesL
MKKMVIFLLIILAWIGVKISSNLTLVEFINQSFLLGIISLLVGACFIILKSGFLSLFFKGFRVIGSMAAPKSRAMARTNQLIEEDEGWQSFNRRFTGKIANIALLIGFSSMTVSLACLVLY